MYSLTITYGPKGESHSDFGLDSLRASITEEASVYTASGCFNRYVTTSTDNVVLLVRLLVAEGVLKPEQVRLVFALPDGVEETTISRFGAVQKVFDLPYTSSKLSTRTLLAAMRRRREESFEPPPF